MNVGRRSAVSVGLVSLAAVLAGCSGQGGTQAGDGSSGRTAHVYVMASETGDDSTIGLGVRNSAKLAVDQAVARGDFAGWDVTVIPVDDKSDKDGATAAAQKIAADDAAVAVVGPVFSGQTSATQKILADAGILQVSSSATAPELTRGQAYATAPKRAYPSFFRIAAPDDAHGPAIAQYAVATNRKRAFVVDDGSTYAKNLAAAFTTTYTTSGGSVIGTGTVDPDGPARFPDLVSRIVAANPQVVMFAGYTDQAAPLSAQVKAAGLAVPLVGADDLPVEKFTVRAGPLAGGDAGTTAGEPVGASEQGKKFLADYRKAGFIEPALFDGPLAYDAAGVAVNAMKSGLRSASSAKDARAAIVSAAGSLSFQGVRGKVGFDQYGDITPRTVTVDVLSGGTWKPAQTFTLG